MTSTATLNSGSRPPAKFFAGRRETTLICDRKKSAELDFIAAPGIEQPGTVVPEARLNGRLSPPRR